MHNSNSFEQRYPITSNVVFALTFILGGAITGGLIVAEWLGV